MNFFAASSIFLAVTATTALAFAPSASFTSRAISQQQFVRQEARLRLIADPSLGDALPHLVSAAASSMGSSSVTTSNVNVIESMVSNLGALVLVGSVGYGVYTGAEEETLKGETLNGETSEEEATEEVETTEVVADDSASLKSSAQPALEEEPAEVEVPVVEPVAKVPVTNKKSMDDALKAIAEVQKKGVQETKEKMDSKSSKPDVEETPSQVAEVPSKKKSSKRLVVKGVTLVVAAGIVVAAKKFVQAWLARGII